VEGKGRQRPRSHERFRFALKISLKGEARKRGKDPVRPWAGGENDVNTRGKKKSEKKTCQYGRRLMKRLTRSATSRDITEGGGDLLFPLNCNLEDPNDYCDFRRDGSRRGAKHLISRDAQVSRRAS